MDDAAGNRSRAAGGRHVFGHRVAEDRRKQIRLDLCRRAEKSGARGRDRGNRAARSGRTRRASVPTLLQYRTHIKDKSLYHTPPTFAVYILGLMMEWIASEGGIAAIEQRNEAKAKLLYDAIDGSGGFYRCPVERESRSKMNVVFRVGELGGDEILEKRFADRQPPRGSRARRAIARWAGCACRSTMP